MSQRPIITAETDDEEQAVLNCRNIVTLIHEADMMSQALVALTHPDTTSAIVSPESTHWLADQLCQKLDLIRQAQGRAAV